MNGALDSGFGCDWLLGAGENRIISTSPLVNLAFWSSCSNYVHFPVAGMSSHMAFSRLAPGPATRELLAGLLIFLHPGRTA